MIHIKFVGKLKLPLCTSALHFVSHFAFAAPTAQRAGSSGTESRWPRQLFRGGGDVALRSWLATFLFESAAKFFEPSMVIGGIPIFQESLLARL